MLRFYAAPAAKTFKNEFFIQWLEIARNILLKIINDFVIVKSTLITENYQDGYCCFVFRLNTYTDTQNVIEEYRKENLVSEFKGEDTVEDVCITIILPYLFILKLKQSSQCSIEKFETNLKQ